MIIRTFRGDYTSTHARWLAARVLELPARLLANGLFDVPDAGPLQLNNYPVRLAGQRAFIEQVGEGEEGVQEEFEIVAHPSNRCPYTLVVEVDPAAPPP